MRKHIVYITSLYLLCSFSPQKKIFIEKIKIGQFYYNIYREHKHSYNENMVSDFYVVYNEQNSQMCSGYISAKHMNRLAITGRYIYNDKKLVITTHYQPDYIKSTDSSISTFYPNMKGKLILINHRDFKDGKVKEYKY